MAESSGSGTWWMGCLFVAGGSLVLCCGGGAITTFFSGDILLWAATSDHPIDVVATPYDPALQDAVRARIFAQVEAGAPTAITEGDLNVLVASPDNTRAHITMAGDQLTFDLSAQVEPGAEQYVNVHVRTAFVMEDGWFTHLAVSEAQLSDWDLGKYVAGQELAMNANQSLAQQRAKDPDLDALIAGVQRMSVTDGTLQVQVDPARIDAFRAKVQAR